MTCEMHRKPAHYYCRECGEMWFCGEENCTCFCHRSLKDYADMIRRALWDHFPREEEKVRQVIAIGEEAGEFQGAARRYMGMARRSDTFEHMAEELADVVITAYVTAEVFEIDLPREIEAKLHTIVTRGYRESEKDPGEESAAAT